MKLPFFPRKALESDLDLYQGGELGKVKSISHFLSGKNDHGLGTE